jgi:hypothetical protein
MRADVRVARFLAVFLFAILIFSLKPVFSDKRAQNLHQKFSKQFFALKSTTTLF